MIVHGLLLVHMNDQKITIRSFLIKDEDEDVLRELMARTYLLRNL